MNRKHERIPMIVEIVLDSSAGRRPSRISDLSMGGCYVDSIASFRVGEPLSFDLKSPTIGTVTFSGEVAYVLEGFGFGLKFTQMGPQQLVFLRHTLSVDQAELVSV